MKTLGILAIGATSIFATALAQTQSSPGVPQVAPSGGAVPAASAQPIRQQRQQQRQIQSRSHFEQPDGGVQQPSTRARQRRQLPPLNHNQQQQQQQQQQPQPGANTGQTPP